MRAALLRMRVLCALALLWTTVPAVPVTAQTADPEAVAPAAPAAETAASAAETPVSEPAPALSAEAPAATTEQAEAPTPAESAAKSAPEPAPAVRAEAPAPEPAEASSEKPAGETSKETAAPAPAAKERAKAEAPVAATPAPARAKKAEPPAARATPPPVRAEAKPKAKAKPAPKPAAAPAPQPAPAPATVAAVAAPAAAPTGIAAAWRRVRDDAASPQGTADFPQAVAALEAARDTEGLDNLETAAQALAGWAHGAVARGDLARAERLSRAAVTLAPGSPEGYLVRARMHWAGGHYPAAAAWALRSAAVGLSHPWVGLAWAGYLVIVFWLAAATALVVLLVPSLWKALRTFHHQVSEYAAFKVPSPIVGAAAVALVLLPVAGSWGLGWSIVAWTLLAWAGDPARGRRVHLFLLLVVLLGPWLCAPLMAPSQPPGDMLELALREGSGAGPVTGTAVPDVSTGATSDWRVAFALGNAALRNGAYDEAVAWYEAARREGGDAVRLTHNEATADFRAGRYEQAERMFKGLAEGGHAPARTLFNLGQAQSRRLDFDGARDSYERARVANAEEYLRVSRMAGAGDAFTVVPFGVTRADLRALTLGHAGHWSDFAGPLWRFLFGSLSMALAPVLVIALAALAWLLPALVTSRRVYSCDVCRGSVCQECMQFIYDAHLCRRCVEKLAGTRGTLADVNMLRERARPIGRPAVRLAGRFVPGLQDLRRGRYGRASFQLMLLAFIAWGVALLGTIPAWAVSVPVERWPVARLMGALLVLLQVAWTYHATADRPVAGPLVERRKRPRRVDIDAA
jgi:tetratricopeptide (TPR) repeat protein